MRRIAIALLVAAAACGSSTEPGGITPATYQLTTYDGGALPALVSTSLGQCGGMVVGGMLTIGGNGQGTFTQSISAPCSAGNPVTTTDLYGALSQVSTGTLVLSFTQPSGSPYADTIQVSGSTATMRHRGTGSTAAPAHVYVFTR